MEIKTHIIPRSASETYANPLIETMFASVMYQRGYGNGYVGVPPGHPWFEKQYDNIEASVHGGLTYSENHLPNAKPDGLWWLGFDTAHYGDNETTCPQPYVEAEVESLKQQALTATQ